MVELYRIYIEMNEKYEVQYGGARLGIEGEIIILTDNVNEGDAAFEKIMSKLFKL